MRMRVCYKGDGVPVYYRPDTTDEKVIREVVDNRAYRRASIGFDVEAGEHWLDLGANIGAFAVYCKTRGATAECYEPEPGCFNILRRNAGELPCHRTAVSNQTAPWVDLWGSSIPNNHYRGTLVRSRGLLGKTPKTVPNLYAGELLGRRYDGVKMDIEGSEFGILDDGLIPDCEKLCLEYHTSRDRSMANLSRRVATLRQMFEVVSYVPELDRMIEIGGEQKSFHDRVIYCIGRKRKTPKG